MTATTTHARPNVEVRALPGGRSLASTPSDEHYVLDVDPATLLRILDAWALSGTGDRQAGDSQHGLLPEDWRERCAALLKVLEGGGALRSSEPDGVLPGEASEVPDPEAAAKHAARGDLLLIGDPRLADAVRRAASGGAVTVRTTALDARAAVHRAFVTGEVVVHCVVGGDDAGATEVDRLCADARTSWVPVELTRSTAWVGPSITPGEGAGYEDLAARRLAAAYDPVAHRSLRTPSVTADAGSPPEHLTHLVKAVMHLLTAPGGPGRDVVVQVRADGSTTRHPVLALPASVTREQVRHVPGDLISPITGLVLRTRVVQHHRDVPAGLRTVQSDVANMRRISRWANNTSCQGSAFDDLEGARAAAVGEAVERYCGNLLDTLPVTAGSYESVRRGGVRVLDPEQLVLYSDAQYDAPGFPFVRLTHDLPVHWVPGRSLTHDDDVLVPASMVFVNWFTAGYSGAALTNFCPFAGVAAGPDLEFATMSALEEVIERHATMVWWLNGHTLPALHPGPELSALWDGTAGTGQRPSLIAVDNEFSVPVVAGVLHHDGEALLNVGFSARHDVSAAARKAWTEALTLQEGSRDLLPRTGGHWSAMASGELNGRSFKPWREDRRYLDDFRADMHDCDDLMVQQQVHLDPRATQRVAPLLDLPATRSLTDVPSVPARSLSCYRERVEEVGHEVVVVNLTSPDVASTGMAVVRVVVPGTVGNAPAAFPFLGRRRVQDLAVELGWRQSPLPEEKLNYFPLPHA